MGYLYASEGRIYNNVYFEIYIPNSYFEDEVAVNHGSFVETFGVVYCRPFPDDKEEPVMLMDLPVTVDYKVYSSHPGTIKAKGKAVDVMVLEYMKDSYVMHQTIPNGREVGDAFLDQLLAGKLPNTINYASLIDLWWKNLELSNVKYKVPSKIYEMIIAAIYRNPHNMKQRYGQLYGAQENPSGYDYKTGNVRSVVKDLSTFSGMVFEDIGTMISNGINNAAEGVEEQVSPLEKIIHY